LQSALGDAATSLGVLPIGDPGELTADGVPSSQRLLPPPSIAEEKLKGGSAVHGDKSTMKMMEELMEELIGFQERFGPGAKSRERRTAVLT
jgi:hypothetical protein